MAKYPLKMLLDENRQPFFPVVTIDTVVVNNSDETIASMFADRYTKEEVDQIIADLGTLQRLCGRVATVADLPANPKPGDTYIVGTGVTNNSEYMYIGNKWEELGPMIDLSAYDTSAQVDSKISTASNSITAGYQAADTDILNQAKQYADTKAATEATAARTAANNYTDTQIASIPTPTVPTALADLSEDSTHRTVTDTEKTTWNNKSDFSGSYNDLTDKPTIPTLPTDLLHYKGHVNTVADLPSTGQPSVGPINPITTIPTANMNTLKTNLNSKASGSYGGDKINAIKNFINNLTYQQYGQYYIVVASKHSYGGFCAFVTDYPEQIKIIPNVYPYFKPIAIYDANKPVTRVGYDGNTYQLVMTTISADTIGSEGLMYDSNYQDTNIPALKLNTTGSVLDESNNYYYGVDSVFIKLDQVTKLMYILDNTLPAGVSIHDTYTVGPTNKIYFLNDNQAFEEWAQQTPTDLSNYYTKGEVDALIANSITAATTELENLTTVS